jgi:hypothetical protein
MTRRRKIVIAIAAPIVLLVGAFIYLSLDESPPDLGPLALERLEIPREENAVTYFDMAGAAAFWPRQSYAGYTGTATDGSDATEKKPSADDMAVGEGWDATAATDILERNKDAFPLIDRGLACRNAQQPPITTIENMSHEVMSYLTLARLMNLKSEALARDGKSHEAIELAVETAEFGHKLLGARGVLVDYLVGLAIKQMGMNKVRSLLARDDLAADRLRPLVGRLAAVTDDGPGLADAFRAEYELSAMLIADPPGGLSAFRISPPGGKGGNALDVLSAMPDTIAWKLGYSFKPNRTARQFAEFYKGRLEEAGRPFSEVHPPPPLRPTGWLSNGPLRKLAPNSYGDMLIALIGPAAGRVHTLKSFDQTESAMTQVLVALKCFKLKTGRLPQKLDELVPEFLPAVPRDDFDGKPIRYSPEKKIVYSVGEDLKDDGGFTKEEARKWWAANKPDEPLEEGKDPRPEELPDLSFPVDF